MWRVQEIHPFHLLAYVILPDHFHWLMPAEDESGNFSTVLHSIKRNYPLNFKKVHGITTLFNLWQARFWDHVIRDEDDLGNHFDHIHWNPISTVMCGDRRTGISRRICSGWNGVTMSRDGVTKKNLRISWVWVSNRRTAGRDTCPTDAAVGRLSVAARCEGTSMSQIQKGGCTR
jgi:hypothetical protein